jgi:hypothetical protein
MRVSLVVVMVAVLLTGGGCVGTGPRQVSITLDKSWLYRSETLPSIEVDIVGVGESENHLWETYSMTDYWSPGDRLRAEADKVVLKFGGGSPISQSLGSDNPVWIRWRRAGVTTILILADLPGAYSDLPGDTDPRRRVLPVKKTAANVEVIIRPYK